MKFFHDVPEQNKRVRVYKVIPRWNVKEAKEEFGLYEATEVHFSDGSRSICVPVMTPYKGEMNDGWFLIATGDKAWSKRTMKHYLPLSGNVESND